MNAITIKNETDLKVFLHKNYLAQIKNFFGDEKQAMKFLSSVMSDVQKNPKLLDCEPITLVNSYMTMAQLGLMPSGISGEAYVLPYNNKSGMIAQFQLGYQGLVTLFYRAGGQSIRVEIIRKNDKFTYKNGKIDHDINIMMSNKERGEVVGAYAVAVVNGEEISKAMNIADIMEMGKKFSKSFSSQYSPWNPANDLEGWMVKKTVLKQLGKMMPKNETIYRAIAEDNKDSILADRLEAAKKESGEVASMGHLLKTSDEKNKKEKNKDEVETTESIQVDDQEGAETGDR